MRLVIWLHPPVLSFLFLLVVFSASQQTAAAEPWMSIRSSQNCAGCHAPGRKNLTPKDRRCTLSCQGCHVNPSGGGIRNTYGRWFDAHWLKSFSIKNMGDPAAIAPSEEQAYDQIGDFLFQTKNKRPSKRKIAAKAMKVFKKKRRQKSASKAGLRLKRSKNYYIDDTAHDRSDGREDDIATSDVEYWLQVPQLDPKRKRLETKVDGGGSFRYQLVSVPTIKVNDQDFESPDLQHFLMNADIGVRWRPAKKHLNLVFEHRVLGSPRENSFSDLLKESRPRSMYLLVDDLPYNSYFQAGAYRFGFGRASPDHTLLTQEILAASTSASKAYNMNYQAVSVGASPNVPFANLHYIHKDISNRNAQGEKWKGFAGQVGMKTVRLGSTASYSFLHLSQEEASGKNQTQAHAVHLGGMLKPKIAGNYHRIIGQFEALHLRKERAAVGVLPEISAKATAVSLDGLMQIWREVYLNGQYSYSDTNRAMQNGSSSQWRIGIKAHLLAGVEVSMRYGSDVEVTEEFNGRPFTELRSTSFVQQVHLYF